MEIKIRGTQAKVWTEVKGIWYIRYPKRKVNLSYFRYIEPTLKDGWMGSNRYTYLTDTVRTVTRYPIPQLNVIVNINNTIKALYKTHNKALISQLSELREYFKSRRKGPAETKRNKEIAMIYDLDYTNNKTMRAESVSKIKELQKQIRHLTLIDTYNKNKAQHKAILLAIENNNSNLLREQNHLKTLNSKRRALLKGYLQ